MTSAIFSWHLVDLGRQIELADEERVRGAVGQRHGDLAHDRVRSQGGYGGLSGGFNLA
ncbi:MAG: hypothetical protein M5U09_03720 [Gammaproteobacteria bacterium]|nr:hypothetical protein [Gammaproteobacteria bacterium]